MEEKNQKEINQNQTQSAEQNQIPNRPENLPLNQEKDIAENKLMAALSYLGILVLVPLLAKKESPFCQFHAKQGLILCIIFVLGWVIFWIPIIGWLLWLAVAIVDIIGLVRTLQGKYWEAPIIHDLSKKINL